MLTVIRNLYDEQDLKKIIKKTVLRLNKIGM